MDNEKEKSLVKWIPEDGIIILAPGGDFDEENATIILDKISEIIDKIPNNAKIKVVVDGNGINMADHISRRLCTEFAKKYKNNLFKCAIYKANTITKLATQFLISAVRREKDLKFFDNLEDSLKWIREQK